MLYLASNTQQCPSFLELCQFTRELAGIPGNGPSTVVGQSGEMKRLVNWVAKAWLDIQNLHQSWGFLLKDFSFTTVQSQGDYTLTEMGAGDLRSLDVDSLRCHQTSLGYTNKQYMEKWDWQPFRDLYRFNNLVEGRPIRFAIDPANKNLCVAAIPDSVGYTITGRYRQQPVSLTTDADVPAIPYAYHMLIVYWALSKYAGYEAAAEVKQEATENIRRLLPALENDQLPPIELGTSF